MRADVFFDSSVLIHALDTGSHKGVAARTALGGGGAVSVQVMNECANALRRKRLWAWTRIGAALTEMTLLLDPPHRLTMQTHADALRVAERGGLTFYDALIVASALGAGCQTLLTEAMQHGRVIDGRLTIRNPFAAA